MNQELRAGSPLAVWKAVGACLVLQLGAGIMAMQFQSPGADWYIRLRDLIMIVFLVALSAAFGLIGYVRFLDWKRGRAIWKKGS